jgi:hypothetical protein
MVDGGYEDWPCVLGVEGGILEYDIHVWSWCVLLNSCELSNEKVCKVRKGLLCNACWKVDVQLYSTS